tara:strand:+ start:29 stop:229 length:201 start_codon:yes stop_codon:yes gene_type:complete
MKKTNQPKETMTKYEIRTFGVKNNYTCALYKVIRHDQLDLIKHTNYNVDTLEKAYQTFLKDNKLTN